VVFDRFDHHLVLYRGTGNLHPARAADRRMGDVPVAADLVARINDDHPPRLREYSGHFAKHGGFSNTRPTQKKDALTILYKILDYVNGTVHGPADSTGEAHNFAAPIPDC
jgi:hypothetical protein